MNIQAHPPLVRTLFQGMIKGCCPRCRQGKVFSNHVLSFKFSRTNTSCSHCGLVYEIEPGLYWGAMYISYFLAIIILLPICILAYFVFNNPEPWVYTAFAGGVFIGLLPLLFRTSRILMLYKFSGIKYEANSSKHNPES